MIDVRDIKTDITDSEHQIRHLQSETIHCIAFKSSGKVEVVDKTTLENLNSEVDRIKDIRAHNTEVLNKLTEALQDYPTVDSIRKKKLGLEERVTRTKNLLRIDTGDLIKHGHDVDPADPYSHPKGKALKAEADAALAIINPALTAVTDLLEQAEAILAEFKPSGLEPQRAETRGVISREKVGGMT